MPCRDVQHAASWAAFGLWPMTMFARLRELLGGEAVTGRLDTELDLVRLMRRGLPAEAVDGFLVATGQSFSMIEPHVVSRRTLNRRRKANQPLDIVQANRLVRIARMVAAAEVTIGDRARALQWLERPNRALDSLAPIAMADTAAGWDVVERLLAKIAHGLAA